jgi:imidazole glycerol-phosphate synthase subunit HisH
MITIVDYGSGNVLAFVNVFKRLNIDAATASTAAELSSATKVILPGVGHFDRAMERLDASGMRGALDELALEKRVPVLGICVGMQILAKSSEEGRRAGLGWIDGRVRRFFSWQSTAELPLPHMGWNAVRPTATGGLFDRLESDAWFYFLHSFYFECANLANSLAVASYGSTFTAAVRSGNVFGVQFHPEKSHRFGTRLLENFAKL